jgi:PKD repeat protein
MKCHAQTLDWLDLFKIKQTGTVSIMDMKTDLEGNIIIAGYNNGNFSINLSNINFPAQMIFLAKFDRTGKLLWMDTASAHRGVITQIELGPNDGYFFSGEGMPFKVNQMPQENSPGFVGKSDKDGRILWIRKYIDQKKDGIIFRVDQNENILFSGNMPKSPDYIKIGAKSYSGSGNNIYCVKFDSIGRLVWINDNQPDMTNRIDMEIDFQGNAFQYTKDPQDTVFIYKYNRSGLLIKKHTVGQAKNDIQIADLKTDNLGNIFVTYETSANHLFGGTMYPAGFYFEKLDSGFNHQWIIALKPLGAFIRINKNQNYIYLASYLYKYANIGNQDIQTAAGDTIGNNFWIAKISENGEIEWLVGSNHSTIVSHAPFISETSCSDMIINISFIEQLHFGNINFDLNKNQGGLILAKFSSDTIGFVNQHSTCGLYLKNISKPVFTKFQWFAALPGDNTYGKLTATTRDLHYSFPHKGKYIITLRGEKSAGCSNIYKDTFNVPGTPVAGFIAADTEGCQYVRFNFMDTSHADTINAASGESWLWDFGDPAISWTNLLSYSKTKRPVVSHIYTQSGTYTVKLVYGNGFCTDTFVSEKKVVIIAAPKPGFTVQDKVGNFLKVDNFHVPDTLKGCAPLDILVTDNSAGQVSNWVYRIIPLPPFQGGIPRFDSVKMASFSQTIDNPGLYAIHQYLTGTTGCVTEDSVYIRVHPGIGAADSGKIKQASVVSDRSIAISWPKDPRAAGYQIMKSIDGQQYDLLQFASAKDSAWTDNYVNTQNTSYSYKIIMTDSCGNLSSPGRKAKTILLQGKGTGNQFAVLTWSPYEDWPGTLQYVVWQSGAKTDSLAKNKLQYTDNSFYQEDRFSQCYTIAAENTNAGLNSRSNTICLPYIPVLWIPNAFSPNGDTHNDTFKVQTIGIAEMHIHIYNRWGEEVFVSNSTTRKSPIPFPTSSGGDLGVGVGWDGNFNGARVPDGLYIYKIEAKSLSGESFYYQGTVQVLK